VTSATRSEALPDVPTIGDTVADYAVSGWLGIAAPRGTPEAVIARLNQEINATLATPAIKARLADAGSTPLLQSAAEFGRLMITDTERWAQVVRSSGAKPE
jgi:tripartite-type tricarboxylate transporter receptor subunit TctC